MPLLTLFSAPKPFTNPKINLIQRNAIQSWLHLGEEVEVFLVGEEPGLEETAREFGIRVLTQVERNTKGTPLIRSIFSLARQNASAPLLAYVNADILLLSDFLDAMRLFVGNSSSVSSARPALIPNQHHFLVLGQRWDLQVDLPLDFSPGWESKLRLRVQKEGSLHPPAGSDYFVFRRHAFQEIPDFAIGRAGWDNWMIYHALERGWMVIDATPSICVIHQNHDYSHLPNSQPHYDLEESRVNISLAGGIQHMYMVLDAPYQLRNRKIKPTQWDYLHLIRRVERILLKRLDRPRGWKWALTRRLRRLRRGVYQ